MQKHKIISLIIAIPAALLLWIYVITSVAPEQTKTISNIPVTIEGAIVLEERGLMITSGETSGITLELDGNRVNISKIEASNMKITVDVSKIYEAGDYNMNYSVSYPEAVAGSQINIIRRSSTTVRLTVSNVETKTVPVTLDWSGTVRDGYLFDAENVEMDTTVISVSGPDYEVAPISAAVIVYDVSPLEETVVETCGFEFRDETGNLLDVSEMTTSSVQQITLTLPILRYKDIKLKLNTVDGGGATAMNADISISPPTIRVTGTAAVIDGMDDTFSIGEVKLAEIDGSETRTFSLTLPAGIKVMTGEKEVKAHIKMKGLQTKQFEIMDIELLNVPDKLEAELSTRSVTVKVRGSEKDIAALSAEDIRIQVDLSEYTQTGAFTVPATVIIAGYEGVGYIGDVNVGVTIR